MFKKVQLYNFIFDLTFTGDAIVASSFNVEGKPKGQYTEEDLRAGHALQKEIFDGHFDWLIKKDGMITLPTYNISVTLTDPVFNGSVRYGGGNIHSSIKETCPYCQNADCDFDCPESSKWQNVKDTMSSIEKRAELEDLRNYNYACEGIESIILGHAVAGVDIESAAYLEGLESAIQGMANNL